MPDATTTDLASWLLHALAADERALRSWDGSCFHIEACDDGWEAFSDRYPADRMLAECDAKRRIIELHGPIDRYDTDSCRECSDSGWAGCVDGHSRVALPCPTLRLLALPYSDRPGYRPEWRP